MARDGTSGWAVGPGMETPRRPRAGQRQVRAVQEGPAGALPAADPQLVAVLELRLRADRTACRSPRSAPAQGCCPTRWCVRTSCSDRPSAPTWSSTSAARPARTCCCRDYAPRRLHHGTGSPMAALMQFRVRGKPARRPRSRSPGPDPALQRCRQDRHDVEVRAQQGPPRLLLDDQRQALRPEARRPQGRARVDRALEAGQHQRLHPLRPPARGAVADRSSATATRPRPGSGATRTPGGWTPTRASWWRRGSPTTPGSS